MEVFGQEGCPEFKDQNCYQILRSRDGRGGEGRWGQHKFKGEQNKSEGNTSSRRRRNHPFALPEINRAKYIAICVELLLDDQ